MYACIRFAADRQPGDRVTARRPVQQEEEDDDEDSGKANQVPPAIEKAQKEAKRKMRNFPMVGKTIPHEVIGRFGACEVRLIPASPGTGIIAGSAVRAPLEMMGLQDEVQRLSAQSTAPLALPSANPDIASAAPATATMMGDPSECS